jgi:hypothetical protein
MADERSDRVEALFEQAADLRVSGGLAAELGDGKRSLFLPPCVNLKPWPALG